MAAGHISIIGHAPAFRNTSNEVFVINPVICTPFRGHRRTRVVRCHDMSPLWGAPSFPQTGDIAPSCPDDRASMSLSLSVNKHDIVLVRVCESRASRRVGGRCVSLLEPCYASRARASPYARSSFVEGWSLGELGNCGPELAGAPPIARAARQPELAHSPAPRYDPT
jgi:hypothetical protein